MSDASSLHSDRLDAILAAAGPFASVGEALTAQSVSDKSPWAVAPDDTPYGNQGLTFGDFRRLADAVKAANLKRT